MQLLLSEIAGCVNGRLTGADAPVSSVSIDTRTLKPGQLYVAIKGERFDGNEFVALAAQAGAVAAIVHDGVAATLPLVTVADTRLALAELAGCWRRRCPAQVVGVTGSNGKTTVKEMLAAILGVAGEVLYTQGNLNNDIGVPLTLLRLDERHCYAVIEMGANHPGEIAYTSRYAQADVVVLNNAGPAHIEGFGSIDGVAKAKGEIIETLAAEGTAVLNRDDPFFDYWQSVAGSRKTVSFGLSPLADVRAEAIHSQVSGQGFHTLFKLCGNAGETEIALSLAGKHNVRNALAASAAALALGLELSQIAEGLARVKPVHGRLQPLTGRHGNLVIDDTYNGNAASLLAGLEVLVDLPGVPWLVLGAFGELGLDSAELHRQMGEAIKASGVQRLFAFGDDCRQTVRAFGRGADYFADQEELINALKQQLTGQETLLVKGSRARRMENVVAALVDNDRN